MDTIRLPDKIEKNFRENIRIAKRAHYDEFFVKEPWIRLKLS